MKIQSAVEEYLVEIEVRKYTPKTIRSYRCNLNFFLRFCAEKLHVETVEALTPAVVRQFSRCMSEAGRKGTYINGVLKSIKSFIQYCYEEGYGGFDTRKTFKWCKEEKPVITAFSPEQVRIMLQSCRGHDYLSLRDYAILTLLFETGIRCWELCCIREEDIYDDFIIINGKNHKQRVVPITPVLKKAMLRYESGKEKYFVLRPRDAFLFPVVPWQTVDGRSCGVCSSQARSGDRRCSRVTAYMPAFFRAAAGENGNGSLYDQSFAGA